jgi:hypothetical protein
MKATGTALWKNAILAAVIVSDRFILHHGLHGDEISVRHGCHLLLVGMVVCTVG